MSALAAAAVPSSTSSRVLPSVRKLVLADTDPVQSSWLEHALGGRPSMSVRTVTTGAELQQALIEGEADLVVTSARLKADSALQILARVRSYGNETPFIVYSSLREQLMRILVSDVRGTLLSSRVVDLDGFVETARTLIDRKKHP